jgi:hypothetical protein
MYHKHILKVARKTMQGGIPNNRYPVEYLTNFRLVYVHPTDAILHLKGYTLATGDTPFYDAFCGDQKAEGKCVNKHGVNFNPSKNVGSGRRFNEEDLQKCFSTNNYYFLYEVNGYDEDYVTFHIYWIPTDLIRSWYERFGKQGKINLKNFQKCLAEVPFEQTQETRD